MPNTQIRDEKIQMDCIREDSENSIIQSVLELSQKESDSEKDPYFAVPQFHNFLFATILEDMLMSLRVLGECNNHIRVLRLIDDMPMHLRKKYSIATITRGELDNIDPDNLGCDAFKLYKLERDRDLVVRTIEATYTGLSLSRSIRPLWNQCQEIMQYKEYVAFVINDHMQNKLLSRTLYKQLRQQRVLQTSAEYESDTIDDDLKKQIENAALVAAIKERYTDKWQNARTEQHQEDISLKQDVFVSSIQYYKKRSEQETVVHGEVEMLTNIYIQENIQKVEDIMAKYETDIEKMDLQLQIMMSEVNKILAINKALKEKFEKQENEIKAWQKFKIDRATAQKYHNDMTRSAIIVQAWWRGLLVRKQLGPFRQHKKKGKAKKKGAEV